MRRRRTRSPLQLAFVLAALAAAPCAVLAQDVVGTWEWVQTVTESDEVLTPDTEGYTVQLEFGAEPASVYREFRDEQLVLSCGWFMTYVWIDGVHVAVLLFEDPGVAIDGYLVAALGGGVLVLSGSDTRTYHWRDPVVTRNGSWTATRDLYR